MLIKKQLCSSLQKLKLLTLALYLINSSLDKWFIFDWLLVGGVAVASAS
jgi:hypothetical protein